MNYKKFIVSHFKDKGYQIYSEAPAGSPESFIDFTMGSIDPNFGGDIEFRSGQKQVRYVISSNSKTEESASNLIETILEVLENLPYENSLVRFSEVSAISPELEFNDYIVYSIVVDVTFF